MTKQPACGPELVAKALLCHALRLAGETAAPGIALKDFRQQMTPWGADAAEQVLQGSAGFFSANADVIKLTAAGASELLKLSCTGEVLYLVDEVIGDIGRQWLQRFHDTDNVVSA